MSTLTQGQVSAPTSAGPLLRLSPRGPALSGQRSILDWGTWGSWGQVEGAAVLATGGYGDGAVHLWDPKTSAIRQTLAGHTSRAMWGAWGQVEGEPVPATGGGAGMVLLWDPKTGAPRGPALTGHTNTVDWGAWGQVEGEPVLATGDREGTVRLWDPKTGAPRGPALTRHTDPVIWGAWAQVEGAPVLATGGDDGMVWLWDPKTGAPRGPAWTGHTDPVIWGAWAQVEGAPVLATGDYSGTVLLWDPKTGAPRGPALAEHAGTVDWGAWGQVDGEPVLATGGYGDGTVRLWDPKTGAPRGPALTGHTDTVMWAAWAQIEGAPVLATGDHEGTVRLWDPKTGAPLGPSLAGRAKWGEWGQVEGAPVLATGGIDGTLQLWDLVREVTVPRVPKYSSDTIGIVDRLDRQGEAEALADVITARSARPPLAVGVFGQWGDGKSLFLEMIENAVSTRSRSVDRHDPIAHGAVRQVRFNAWHYAEADLWASLVAELFKQLSSPHAEGDPAIDQRQQSRLTAELIQARGVREQLTAAEARLAALRKASSQRVPKWESLPASARQQFIELFGVNAEERYKDLARTGSVAFTTARWVPRLIRGLTLRQKAVVVIGALLTCALIIWGPGLMEWLAAVPAVVVLGAIWQAVSQTWKQSQPLRTTLGQANKVLQRVRDEQANRQQTAEAVAAAEVAELRTRLQNFTAAGQLAGLVEERAGTGTYRERLGLMTQIRQDFERMATLLLSDGSDSGVPVTDPAGDQLPAIDRIVVYIDDLDRCPPHRVVEVLEAIHLLLAVPLFVVVVAVDPRWLLRSLTSHYQHLFAGTGSTSSRTGRIELLGDLGEEELWSSTPAQYLEKIFQIVITLPPMENAGYRHMIDDLLGVRVSLVTESPITAESAGHPITEPADTLQPSDAPWIDPTQPPRFASGSVPTRERRDPLALTSDEYRLIEMLGPPLITAPRAVKRLANSYGLLVALKSTSASHRGSRSDLEPVPDIGGREALPYRAAIVLLGTVVGFPMLGTSLFPDLHRTGMEATGITWSAYLDTLRPVRGEHGWGSRLEATMTVHRAEHWHALLDALNDIGVRASNAGLPLPARLDIWSPWVVPVGRLSFPTGTAVSRLPPNWIQTAA